MKIAFLCSSPSWGGLEMNVWRLAQRLQARGHDVVLLAQPNTPIFQRGEGAGLKTAPLKVKKHYIAINAAKELAQYLKKNGFQTVIFSLAKDNYVAGWAKVFFYPALQLIYMQQMLLGIPKKGPIQTFMYRLLSAWVAPLHLLAEQVIEKTHMSKERVHVIPLGIDTHIFSRALSLRKHARQHFKLAEDIFVVGIVGRLDPAKGQEVLIKAIAQLHKKNRPIHALLVGEETRGDGRQYLKYLQGLTQSLQIEKFIHFGASTDQTEMAFAALDVFIMASQSETYGMVTIEAMATGLPIIGTNSGGTPELLDRGRLGILVAPQKEQDLAKAIEKLYQNELLRKQLGALAQEKALTSFDYRIQCEQMEALVKDASNMDYKK